MKKITYIIISLLITFNINANVLLSQGRVSVTVEDFDGYAYRVPEKDRKGYFDSPKRIEDALLTILNMKHIIQYGTDKNMIDFIRLEIDVDNRMASMYPNNVIEFDAVKEKQLTLIRNFIKIEETFRQVRKEIRKIVDKNDLIELAEEKYIVNKSQYILEESRDIDFISVLYTKTNKSDQKLIARAILKDLVDKKKTFKQASDELKEKQADIEIYRFNQFKYDKNHPEFSYKLFSIEDMGFFPEIITFNNRFILVNIDHIEKAKQLTFEDKKEELLDSLEEKSIEIKYKNILLSLTKDKVIIEESNVVSLISRY